MWIVRTKITDMHGEHDEAILNTEADTPASAWEKFKNIMSLKWLTGDIDSVDLEMRDSAYIAQDKQKR